MTCSTRVRSTLHSILPLRVPLASKPSALDNTPNTSSTFIHILDQDSLLHIFYLCQPVLLNEAEIDDFLLLHGGVWTRERWWYKLVQVCRRWRYLILDSAHHLRLSLVVSRGTPVAKMLQHFPSLPLTIIYDNRSTSITSEEERRIIHALEHRDRVRHIRLDSFVSNLRKIIMALEGEFPILEVLWLGPTTRLEPGFMLPKSLRAPHLRRLGLSKITFPIRAPLFTTSINLVTLSLEWLPPSVYFHPNDIVHPLSQVPRLEALAISFHRPGPKLSVNREPLTTYLTLPNLRWFVFQGAGAYLEALLPCMTAPLLANLRVNFFHPLTFHIPHLVQFLNTAENLRFSTAKLDFLEDRFYAKVYPDAEAEMYTLYMEIVCEPLEQVATAARIVSVLRSAFSVVESLTLTLWVYQNLWSNNPNRTQWRDFLRSFSNVKALRVSAGLVSQLSRSLQLEDGESPVELLPELKELSFPYRPEVFTAFIDTRRIAGRPVTVVHR